MINKIINVDGMTCNHCAKTIENGVNELGGIRKVEVDFMKKLVKVNFDETLLNIELIQEAIITVGFKVKPQIFRN